MKGYGGVCVHICWQMTGNVQRCLAALVRLIMWHFGLTALISPAHACRQSAGCIVLYAGWPVKPLESHRAAGNPVRGGGESAPRTSPIDSNWVTNQPKYIMHRKLCGNYKHTHTHSLSKMVEIGLSPKQRHSLIYDAHCSILSSTCTRHRLRATMAALICLLMSHKNKHSQLA